MSAKASIHEETSDDAHRCTLHNAGRLAWGSGPRGDAPEYTGLDVIITRDGKISALYVFLDSTPS